ncbi:MAG: FTR1 family iron permease [Chloroflexota bacterium]
MGAVLLLVLAVFATAAPAMAATPQEDLKNANELVSDALGAASAGDLTTARANYADYENRWFDVEDGVKATSPDSYRAIETAMRIVTVAFSSTPTDPAMVVDALTALDETQDAFIATGDQPPASLAPGTANGGQATVGSAIGLLTDAQAAVVRNDYATATQRLKSFNTAWLDVEGQVKTRSADDYRQTEVDMALATSLASQQSPQAGNVIGGMITRLGPYAEAQQTYGIFDAMIILLREGLEALLVVVALTAFLKRSRNSTGQTWVWSGATAGLLLSIALGLGIQAFFGAIINPGNREIMEGSIGLVAAAMLIYVSYWLHSKSSLGGWQSYINSHTREAVGGGRMFGLAVLAFLAVFREGAETSLFYLGMASNIATSDLLIGLALGAVILLALGVLMVGLGLRIPMRPFFTVASLLVFYLCFKFVGMGIHALQVAGAVPTGSAAYLPTLDAIGLYPTWPTTIAQLVLLLAAAAIVLRERIHKPSRESRDESRTSRPLVTSTR